VSSLFYILFSKHYILSRETSNNHPSGYEADLSPKIQTPLRINYAPIRLWDWPKFTITTPKKI